MFEYHMRPETIEALNGVVAKLKRDYDATWIYTGDKREGKSTLSLHHSDFITSKLKSNIWLSYFFWSYPGEKEYIPELRRILDLEHTNIYPASVQHAQENGGQFDNLDVDEAVAFLKKGNWNGRDAQTFTINHDAYGYKNFVYHLSMPTFGFIKGFREERIHLWMYIPIRGEVHYYKPIKHPKKRIFPDTPVWFDQFPKLDKEREKLYTKTKKYMLDFKKEIMGEHTMKEQMQKIAFNIHGVFPQATQEEIADCVGVTQQTISNWFNKKQKTIGM